MAYSKNIRTLDMYVRLCEGKIINKSEDAKKFDVDERSIQRDIDDIRAFLDERSVTNSTEHRSVIYDRSKKGFIIKGDSGSLLTNSEILAVSKIILESRAFTKTEVNTIIEKLISGCVPLKNMKLVSDLLANEKYHYVELHNQSHIQDKLWILGNSIKQCELVEITYEKKVSTKETVSRIVEPVAILFSEYYFYLNAYIVENSESDYKHVYDYPAVFRIDRIKDYKEIGEKFRTTYTDRFEEGEFRKRIQFMYAGKLMKIQLKYTGKNVEAVLDRLPTAKIISSTTEAYIIEAEVFGNGILMWILSQGKNIEILKPTNLRETMKNLLLEMTAMYL